MAEVSVVVPTYNRMDVLPEVLRGLEAQIGAPEFEVVVVDDGSEDGTWDWLQSFSETTNLTLTIHRQENAGPATARNWGVQVAQGDRVAFLGDDTVPSEGWLALHLAAVSSSAEGGDVAVIGYTGWHQRMRLNPFLRYINEFGLQFGYALIDDPTDVPFNFLYTSNLSMPRRCLLEEPFDLSFPYAAWEDIELSYRLKKRGLRLIYEPRARVAHDHPTDLERFMSRQEKAGFSAVVFHRLHPELGGFLGLGPDGPPPVPSPRRQALKVGLAHVLHYLPVSTPRLWESILRFHYIKGLHRGWAERVMSPKTQDSP